MRSHGSRRRSLQPVPGSSPLRSWPRSRSATPTRAASVAAAP
jgi:hypothetical protein